MYILFVPLFIRYFLYKKKLETSFIYLSSFLTVYAINKIIKILSNINILYSLKINKIIEIGIPLFFMLCIISIGTNYMKQYNN